MALKLAIAPSPSPTPGGTRILGPNTKIAMLRTLALKATTLASTAWQAATYAAHTATRLPGWVGHMTLSVLSTPAGYTTTVHLIHKATRGFGAIFDRGLVAAGTLIATATGAAVGLFAQLLPGLGSRLVAWHADLIDTVITHYTHLRGAISSFTDGMAEHAHSPLVKYAATRAAGVASAALIIHILTQGVLATKALHLAPALATGIVFLTNPWWLLATVGGITGFTLVWSRLTNPEMTVGSEEDIRVTVTPDGSITVDGVPAGLSESQRQEINDQIITDTIRTMEAQAKRRHTTAKRRPATRKAN